MKDNFKSIYHFIPIFLLWQRLKIKWKRRHCIYTILLPIVKNDREKWQINSKENKSARITEPGVGKPRCPTPQQIKSIPWKSSLMDHDSSLRPLHLSFQLWLINILRKWISPSPISTIWVTQNYSSTSFTGQSFRFLQRVMLSFLFLLISVNQNFLVPSAVPQRINLASPNWMHSGFKYLS